MRVEEIDQELKNLDSQATIVKSLIAQYQKEIDDLTEKKTSEEEAIDYLAQQSNLDVPTLEAKLIILEKNLAEVQSYLRMYKEYCEVLAKIIVKMKFIKKNDDASTTIFRVFVKNFSNDPDVIRQLEAHKKNRSLYGISSKLTDKLKQGIKNFYRKGKEKLDAKPHSQTKSRASSVEDEEAEPTLEEMAEQIDSHHSYDELEEEFHEADQDLKFDDQEERVIVRY
ncbi:MAG: hypothetical protein ACSNEK_10100 [Parachlamydiaceae bacterium]